MFFGHYKGKINLRYAEIRRGRANGKRMQTLGLIRRSLSLQTTSANFQDGKPVKLKPPYWKTDSRNVGKSIGQILDFKKKLGN